MKYRKIDSFIISELVNICGEKDVLIEKEKMVDYAHDEFIKVSEQTYPEVVVKPASDKEVSKILSLASENFIPVTVRGSGTGLCGGGVSFCGGIMVSMERMNRIIEIDEKNFTATVEAGVTLNQLVREVEKHNLFFPPKPGDDYAMIGGMIATNAGGSRVVKYGSMRSFVRGVKVVLSDGSLVSCGGKLIKNCAGYSLVNLFVGSEGTLGIITEATISLMTHSFESMSIVVPYNSINDAINSVPEILKGETLPVAVEFVELEPILLTEKLIGKEWPVKNGSSQLLIVLDSSCGECLEKQLRHIEEVCKKNAISPF